MTREEAIRILKDFSLCGVYHQLVHMNDVDSEAMSMAIKALEQPEIIRCKDCMHNGSYDTDCPIDWNGKEYCSFAERREEGGE